MLLVEKFADCTCRLEANQKEHEIMTNLRANMNTRNAHTSEEDRKKNQVKRYINNKQAIREKQDIKVQCECGCISTRNHIVRHRKSSKHLNNMEKIEMVRYQNAIDDDNDNSSTDCESE